jgi:pimeloyl-ACP methyl ester carboxylesterase
MENYFYDKSRVRYALISSHEGKPYNWLFLPGGPGANSSYFHSLRSILKLPGNIWFIDFPGSGDNVDEVSSNYNFDNWLDIFLSVITRFENPIIVGHSFGGMFPLLFPDLEKYLKGFIILNSSPSLWLEEAVLYAKKFNLPDLTKEMNAFTQNPSQATFKMALDACMPYYFPKMTLDKGRALLSSIPFQFQPAVWWQRKAIELNFSAKWIPEKVPTLIIGGKYDCICPFSLFQKDKRFNRSNIHLFYLEDGGHLGWIENPNAIKNEFMRFVTTLDR